MTFKTPVSFTKIVVTIFFIAVAICPTCFGLPPICQKALVGGSLNNYKTTHDDAKSYWDGYSIFLKRTDFRDRIEEEVQRYLVKNAARFQGKTIRILDIGCGDGEMTARYLRAVAQAVPNARIEIDLVEPANASLEKAVQNLKKLGLAVETRPFAHSMEDFIQTDAFRAATYDWVIASYVFYHIKSSEVVPATLTRLSPNGLMTIAMGSPNHPLRQPEALKNLSRHGDSRTVSSVLEDQNVAGAFQYELDRVKTTVNLNGLVDQRLQPNSDGKSFFSFIYNYDLDRFSELEAQTFKNLITEVFEKQGGFVSPEHHLFWIWRKE